MGMEKQTAIVTGAARGIGQAVAIRLSDHGATVALVDQDAESVRSAARTIPRATPWPCDITDLSAVRAAVQRIEERHGAVGVLVNVAGIWRHTPVLEAESSDWDAVFSVNVKGVLFCSQVVAERMLRRSEGAIINVASVAAFGGSGDWSAYCASKAAVVSLTLSLADALRDHNIRVDAVCPGATQTDMLEQIKQTEPGSEFSLVHRPEEVAEEILKLIVPWGQPKTGRVVRMKPVASALGVPVG